STELRYESMCSRSTTARGDWWCPTPRRARRSSVRRCDFGGAARVTCGPQAADERAEHERDPSPHREGSQALARGLVGSAGQCNGDHCRARATDDEVPPSPDLDDHLRYHEAEQYARAERHQPVELVLTEDESTHKAR